MSLRRGSVHCRHPQTQPRKGGDGDHEDEEHSGSWFLGAGTAQRVNVA
jgi:hypothetical protein